MTCEEAVSFYHGLLRFGVQPGLERIRALCKELGDPQNSLRVIHVAGTNGKGSVCAMLSAVLTAAGYRTGLYTSPYVIDFRERIRLNGGMIPPERLVDVTAKVKEAVFACNARGVFPTEFEAITAAAFFYYAQESCDCVVLETGLGGRYDATNLIPAPLVCVVTSISLDHTSILGDTLAAIAEEKAGILKPGVPAVASVQQPEEALRVLQNRAEEIGASLYLADSAKAFTVVSRSLSGTEISANDRAYRIPFPGDHQLDNAALVFRTLDILREGGLVIDDRAVRDGIASAFMPARTEILCERPLILLDGSHNEGSVRALSALLKERLYHNRIIAVLGMMADKDVETVLSLLLPRISDFICVTPSNPRALSSDALRDMIAAMGGRAQSVPDPVAGFETALSALDGYDALVVCGSLYLAGDLRAYAIKRIAELH